MDREEGPAIIDTSGSAIRTFRLSNHRLVFSKSNRSTVTVAALTICRWTQSAHATLRAGIDRYHPQLVSKDQPLIIAGNPNVFSVGADLNEITRLSGPEACEFSKTGQTLMNEIDRFPAPVYAAIEGQCMGGGLDLAIACHRRIAAPNAVFGHRGAALGLVTGWAGTQRLPRLIGRARALQMFAAAERITADQGLDMGLVGIVAPLPEKQAIARLGIS